MKRNTWIEVVIKCQLACMLTANTQGCRTCRFCKPCFECKVSMQWQHTQKPVSTTCSILMSLHNRFMNNKKSALWFPWANKHICKPNMMSKQKRMDSQISHGHTNKDFGAKTLRTVHFYTGSGSCQCHTGQNQYHRVKVMFHKKIKTGCFLVKIPGSDLSMMSSLRMMWNLKGHLYFIQFGMYSGLSF